MKQIRKSYFYLFYQVLHTCSQKVWNLIECSIVIVLFDLYRFGLNMSVSIFS